MPLSLILIITNTGTTFPLAYCLITSESTRAFGFMLEMLTMYVFYNCPEPRVILADFAKGLGAALIMQVEREKGAEMATRGGLRSRGELSTFPPAPTILLPRPQALGGGEEEVQLQYCKRHTIEAINKRLIRSGRYGVEGRETVVGLINDWIKVLLLEEVEKKRAALTKELHNDETNCLLKTYKPPEPQFLRMYVRQYRNLGAQSTYKVEGYHTKTKDQLHNSRILFRSVQIVATQVLLLKEQHEREVNYGCRCRSTLLDLTAFGEIVGLLTNYALEKIIPEWNQAKHLAGAIEEGSDFTKVNQECLSFELPARFGLPSKH